MVERHLAGCCDNEAFRAACLRYTQCLMEPAAGQLVQLGMGLLSPDLLKHLPPVWSPTPRPSPVFPGVTALQMQRLSHHLHNKHTQMKQR